MGFAEKTKGAVKQGAGKVSGDKDMEHEGKADKAKVTCTRPLAM